MTFESAMERAEAEFELFQILFAEKMVEFPELSYEEINDQVVYEHPTFDDKRDQELYDQAALVVALGTVLAL